MATVILTATCPGIRELQIPDENVITSDKGRVIWEQDFGVGGVRSWGVRWDDGTVQEGQGGPV